MQEVLFVAVGILGGFVRALYGLLKALNRGEQIHGPYFFITLVISGFIGGLLGIVFDMDFKITALAGYVGTDILENLFKSTIPKKIVVKEK